MAITIEILRRAGLSAEQILQIVQLEEEARRTGLRDRQRRSRGGRRAPSQDKRDSCDAVDLRRKSLFPEGWEPELGFGERREFEKFKASAIAHGRCYADWGRAWRYWLMNVPNFNNGKGVFHAANSDGRTCSDVAREMLAGIGGEAGDDFDGLLPQVGRERP